MSTTLVFRQEDWETLLASLGEGLETAGFLIAGLAESDDEQTLLVRAVRWVPDEAYLSRTRTSMSISSAGFVPSLAAADDDAAVAVFVHTHPGGHPEASDRDDQVDAALRGPAQLRSNQKWYASLILGGIPEGPSFTGRLWNEAGEATPISRIRVIGRHLRIVPAADQPDHELDIDSFDRHVRAFGEGGQRLISQLRVGVVGVGGTGSAVAEQLARLGVKHLTLIDDKAVTTKNLTRIHESSREHIGVPKVDVLAHALEAIELGTDVVTHQGRITDEPIARALRHLDVVFGCTDDQRGRAVLSRLAVWYLIPVFDMGFVIDPDEDGRIDGLYGRVTTLLPGTACLLCREHITPNGIRDEGLPPDERERRVAEGYAPGLGDPDPSVGTFTTLTAMFALNAMLERLIGYSPEAGASTELVIRLHELKLSRNSRPATPHHFCGNAAKWGRGDTTPLMEITW